MLPNYPQNAWPNLAHNNVYSAINLRGLAIGMAIAMLLGFWVMDERSFDQDNPQYGRIAQIMQHHIDDGQMYTNFGTSFSQEAE